jgi:hypothetical protein
MRVSSHIGLQGAWDMRAGGMLVRFFCDKLYMRVRDIFLAGATTIFFEDTS